MPEVVYGLGGGGTGGGGGGGTSGIDLTLAGNTAGVLAFMSSGTVTLAGGNNITLSQAGNAVTISGGGGVFSAGVSTGGNTLGTTGAVTNRMVLVGGTNITLSQSSAAGGATVTIIGASGGAGGGVGLSAGTQSVSTGTVVFADSNGITWGMSGSNQITASYSQSTQAEGTITLGMSNLGNTSGTTGVVTGTGPSFMFAGGSNITLSQSLNGASGTITIIGASGGTGQGYTAGLSTIGNTSGDATNVTGRLIFAGGNNITLSGSTNAGSMTITISAPSGGGAGVSSGGNTAGTTGTVDTQIVFVGGSNVSLSQSINGGSATVTINAATAGGGGFQSAGISTQGNTSGTTGFASSQILLVGGANITLSQSINAGNVTLTISGGAGGAGYTAGDSTGGNTSGDTGAVTGRLILAGGNNITLSGSTNAGSMTLTISGPTGGGAGMSTQGNTAGTTGTVGAQLIFVGGSNISLSQSVNGNSATLTINAATAGGGQTAISGIANSQTTYTSGTVSFSELGAITIRSTTGNQYQFSVNAQTVGSQSIGMSNLGNTSGTTGMASGGQVFYAFAGGSNITLSQSLNGASGTLTIIGASGGGAGLSAGMSTAGNTSGDTGYVTGRLNLVGGNNVTLSGSTNAGSMSITISGPTGGGAGMSTGGNTAGTTGTVGAQLVFVGGSNISLSQSINGNSATLTINGASGGGAAFSAGVSTGGNTAGTTGTVSNQVLFVGGNNVTLSQSSAAGGATVTISAFSQTVQTQGFLNSISINGNTSGTSSAGSGSLVLAGGPNITLSASTAAGGMTVSFSANATVSVPPIATAVKGVSSIGSTGTITRFAPEDHQHAGVFSIGMSTGGNTAGTTAVLPGQMIFAGGNNITLSQSSAAGNLMTLTISAASQSVQAEGTMTLGASNLGNTLGTSGVATGTGVQFIFVGSNNITASQSINGASGTITFLGVTSASLVPADVIQSVTSANLSGTQNSFFARGDHQHAGVGPAGVSTFGNTAGSTAVLHGQLVFVGSNNITLSQSTDASNRMTISISGAAGAGNFSAGMSTAGNTSGDTGYASQRINLVGSNNITLSGSTNGGSMSITISGPTGGGAGISTGGNTSGTSGTVGAQLVFVGGNGITLSQSTAAGGSGTITISGAGITVSTFEALSVYASTVLSGVPTATSAIVSLQPFYLDNFISVGAMNLMASMSFVTLGTSSGRQTAGVHAGIYSRGTGASSTQLQSLKTQSVEWNITGNNSSYSINQITATSFTGYGATAQTSSAGVNITSGYTGMKIFAFPMNILMTPGVYWLAFMATNSTSSINVGISLSTLGVAVDTKQTAMAPMGSFSSAYSLSPDPFGQWHIGLGSWSSAGSVTKLPDTMAFTSISGNNTQIRMFRLWST